jgi:hypothetical protein
MSSQIEAVKRFDRYLRPLRIVYPYSAFTLKADFFEDDTITVSSSTSGQDKTGGASTTGSIKSGFSLPTFLYRQKLILHGAESRTLRYIPKIIYALGEQLKKLATKWQEDGIDPYKLKQLDRISSELEKDLSELSGNHEYIHNII